MPKKSVTYTWDEKSSEQEGMTTLTIQTAGEPYQTDIPADSTDFAKAAAVVAVQDAKGKPA